ncbi:MAG TPA: (Fe-S)-binding protein, partial [Spirochaetota bacterium]|nr:(Fe-S)-binding protein [Spirochaetota bacterium]
NKIFGVALIIEAVLFDAQTSNSLSFRHFKKLREISDHCTICHKCQVPCPVNIDFGSVTLNIRDLLVDRKKAKFKAVTGFTLYYLRQKGYYFNKVMRLLLLRMGYSFQRLGYRINRPFAAFTSRLAPKISGYLRSALPRAGQKTLREVVGVRGSSTFISFENRALPVRDSVVYFPGCGSERMFSDISMAAVALLYNAGVRVVLPPEYLCCGYPLLANGKTEQAELKSYDNRVKFHKMANIISYMEIGHVLVTCGTCFEMLESYEMGNIFPDAEIMDVSEYVRKNGLYAAEGAPKGKVLYHDPCHTPLKHAGYREIIPSLTGANARLLPYCCGEGGTLALSTPELSNSLRERKAEDLRRLNFSGRAVLLTTCPSCVQGLSRLERDFPVKVKPLVVHAAEKYLGKDWKKKFLKEVKKGGYESIIF